MSLGSTPPPSNPYAFPQNQNPNQVPPGNSGTQTQLTIVGSFLLTMGVITLGLVLVGMIGNAMDGKLMGDPPPGMPANQQLGFKVGNIGGRVGMILFQVIASCGALCMILRKAYPLAMAGAIVSLIPLCGPCLGLSIPFGIWALVLLLRPEVKSAF